MKLPVFIEDYRLSIHGDGKKDVFRILCTLPEGSEETRTAIVEIPVSDVAAIFRVA